MAKIKVRLRDKGSIFRDASQGVTLTGKQEAEVVRTQTIMEAVRGGALILVEEVTENDSKEEVVEDNKHTTETTETKTEDVQNDSEKVEEKEEKSETTETIEEQDQKDTKEDDKSEEVEEKQESKEEVVEDKDLSLTDLREKYPEISARSKDAFLEKIKDLNDNKE